MFGLRKRSLQETPRLEAPAIWSDFLESLRPDGSYNQRLEAILAALAKVVGFSVYYPGCSLSPKPIRCSLSLIRWTRACVASSDPPQAEFSTAGGQRASFRTM
jgi:hypothetical protein